MHRGSGRRSGWNLYRPLTFETLYHSDVPLSIVKVGAEVDGNADQIKVFVTAGGKVLSHVLWRQHKSIGDTVPDPHLWSPNDPFLYDLEVQLTDQQGKVLDE